MISWALDPGPRDYLPGIAQLNGEVRTAGKATTWYLTDDRGNPVSKKAWLCKGNSVSAKSMHFNALLDTRRLGRGRLYYWIIESKSGSKRHRYAHPFRLPTKPVSAYAAKHFSSRLRTRELPWDQSVADALAGKPPSTPSTGTTRVSSRLAPPSDFAASYDASGDGTPLLITFRNTTSSLLRSVRVYWNLGRCPQLYATADLGGARFVDPAAPGRRVRIDDGLPSAVPGGSRHLCAAAWSMGKNGSFSARVTATFELPPAAG